MEGQIKAHRDIISVLEEVKSFKGLKAFDRKVINKRITDCFYECERGLKTRVHYLRFRYYQYTPNSYTLDFSTYKTSGESYPYTISNECTVYGIPVVDSKRFDYAGFIECIDKSLDNHRKELEQLESELKVAEDIVAEYNRIKGDIDKFEKKYSYYIRQDAKFKY